MHEGERLLGHAQLEENFIELKRLKISCCIYYVEEVLRVPKMKDFF